MNSVLRLENGHGATLENVLCIARALGVLDSLTNALDPCDTDLGRALADEALRERIRHRRSL